MPSIRPWFAWDGAVAAPGQTRVPYRRDRDLEIRTAARGVAASA